MLTAENLKMMENNKSTAGSNLFGGLGGGLSGSGGGLQGLSPYLNIDPSYLQSSAPEYLFDQEAKRGKVLNIRMHRISGN
jgi:hypothetical protein